MMKLELICIQGAEKVLVNQREKRRFGLGPNMALSIDSLCEPLENLKVLSSTLVMLFAIAPACRSVLWY